MPFSDSKFRLKKNLGIIAFEKEVLEIVKKFNYNAVMAVMVAMAVVVLTTKR